MSKRGGSKRKRIDMNPANKANFALICSACGAEFFADETIALDAETEATHWSVEHPDLPTPQFHLIWRGIGPAPKSLKKR